MKTDKLFDKHLREYFENKKFIKYKDIEYVKQYIDLSEFNLSNKDIKYHIKFNIPFCEHKCPICGGIIHVDAKCLNFPCACSAVCRSKLSKIKRETTLLNKYGVTNPMNCKKFKLKQQQSTFKSLGVYTPAKSDLVVKKMLNTKKNRVYDKIDRKISEDTKQRIKTSLVKKYGVDCIFKTKEFKDKLKKFNLNKYGVEYYSQTDEFKNKYRETCLKKYGKTHFFKTKEGKSLISEKSKNRIIDSKFKERMASYKTARILGKCKTTYKRIVRSAKLKNVLPLFKVEEYKGDKYKTKYRWKCLNCNKEFYHYYANGIIPTCPYCSHKFNKKENEFYSFINKICKKDKLEIHKNIRTIIPPLELDIYIPKLNIAFEFNGNYWHSNSLKKDKNYHLNKTKLCEEKGIRLVHIFEYEWDENKKAIKQKINLIFKGKEIINSKETMIKVSRAWFSKVNNIFVASNYELIAEEAPEKITIPIGTKNKLDIFNCGYLIYKNLS